MGIAPSELNHITPYELGLYKEGYQKAQVSEWERTRFVAWMVQATQTTKPLSIQEVLPLPSDTAAAAPKGPKSETPYLELDAKTQAKIKALFEKHG